MITDERLKNLALISVENNVVSKLDTSKAMNVNTDLKSRQTF